MICALFMWEKVNNNALTPWNHPLLLLLAFCLHWGMFAMMIWMYFSMYRLKIVKWCCCTDTPHCSHDSLCGGCKKYSYKLIEIVKNK